MNTNGTDAQVEEAQRIINLAEAGNPVKPCTNHPERETPYVCSKHGIALCEQCLSCRDPELFCKFRTACPIWFREKKSAGLDDAPSDAA